MSFDLMLEIANTQNSIESLVDAIAIQLDNKRLQSSTEILSEHAVKIGVKHATSEEVAALINSMMDTASINLDMTVVEASDGNNAIVIFNDVAGTEIASLLQNKHIEIAASPLTDDEDDDDEPYVADPDDDEDDEDEEDEADIDNPNKMKIVSNEEAFKLASRLHALSCGNDKSEFAHFLTSLDKLLNGFRQSSGYEPPEVEEEASANDFAAEIASLLFEEVAKKKKHKSGRAGFLSAFMKIIGKMGDKFGEAWDALDVEDIMKLLADAGSDLIDQIVAERKARGLDTDDSEVDSAAKALEQASKSVNE